ncbi:helix-turn-helix domain-containing protein [Nonomuraea fuscirosea]|uniref:helix-turn-helix transcriptional regulator n=1 Tax=Nonomuraea fuscirosea TaxID=1291556 RepID=UPI002DD98349|nr:helix-turn-helix domain-containing protein [Nonomuraea fuscirosea]WSA57394.1 winged helix-turn-helix domain-containing protein [Nonomuraea fuscirosea]
MEHAGQPQTGRPWTFLTNHARVLIEITRHPNARLREIAAVTGITERAVQAIVTDLENAGYITRTRLGRRTHYSVDASRPFRHPADAGRDIEGLIALFTEHDAPAASSPERELTP